MNWWTEWSNWRNHVSPSRPPLVLPWLQQQKLHQLCFCCCFLTTDAPLMALYCCSLAAWCAVWAHSCVLALARNFRGASLFSVGDEITVCSDRRSRLFPKAGFRECVKFHQLVWTVCTVCLFWHIWDLNSTRQLDQMWPEATKKSSTYLY